MECTHTVQYTAGLGRFFTLFITFLLFLSHTVSLFSLFPTHTGSLSLSVMHTHGEIQTHTHTQKEFLSHIMSAWKVK